MKQTAIHATAFLIAIGALTSALGWDRYVGHARAQALINFTEATSSQPLALSADDSHDYRQGACCEFEGTGWVACPRVEEN